MLPTHDLGIGGGIVFPQVRGGVESEVPPGSPCSSPLSLQLGQPCEQLGGQCTGRVRLDGVAAQHTKFGVSVLLFAVDDGCLLVVLRGDAAVVRLLGRHGAFEDRQGLIESLPHA